MILRVQYKIKLFSLFSIWSAIVPRLSGVACVLLFSTGIEGLFIGRIFAVVITVPILWKLCFNKLKVFSEKVPDKLFYTMGTYGFPIVISSLAAWFLRLSDRYLIAFFKSSYEVGLYSVSYNISEKSIAIIIALFLLADRPIAMELWESTKSDEQKVKVKSFLTATSRYFLLMAVPVCFGIWAIGKQVVSILVASDYHEGYVVLPFVVFGLFLSGVANRYQLPILFYKKTKFIMINTLIAGTLNVILNIIFIPKYGYFAAAVTTLISYISYLTITVCFSRGLFKWPFPLKSLIRISVASAIMFVGVRMLLNLTNFGIFLEVLLGVVSGIAIYIFFIFIFGEISASEKQELFKIAKSTFKIRKR